MREQVPDVAGNVETVSRPRRTGWVLPVILLVLMFAIPSVKGGAIVDPAQIPEFIKSVLMQPCSESIPALLPVAKFALLAVAIVGIVGIGPYSKMVLSYYAIILAVMAVFQNTATVDGGVAIILGNTVTQLIVTVVCVLGLRHATTEAPLRRERLWLLPLMLWAWAYPFAIDAGTVVAGGWSGMLTNAAGVTYCMVTPVIAGTMALRPAAYGRTARAIVGWLGLLFGLLNMMTWFVLNTESWWMGVLHLPLLVIAGFLTFTTWREPRT